MGQLFSSQRREARGEVLCIGKDDSSGWFVGVEARSSVSEDFDSLFCGSVAIGCSTSLETKADIILSFVAEGCSSVSIPLAFEPDLLFSEP
jgi:hypothetical protein